MAYLEELLPEFRKGAKIRRKTWGKGRYIKLNESYVRDEYDDLCFLEPDEVIANDWLFYQEPINWDYIIKNKCLCWFWDDDESEKIVSILINAEKDEYTPFLLYGECYFEHCRPVRRDEVNFYEDKRDEI